MRRTDQWSWVVLPASELWPYTVTSHQLVSPSFHIQNLNLCSCVHWQLLVAQWHMVNDIHSHHLLTFLFKVYSSLPSNVVTRTWTCNVTSCELTINSHYNSPIMSALTWLYMSISYGTGYGDIASVTQIRSMMSYWSCADHMHQPPSL